MEEQVGMYEVGPGKSQPALGIYLLSILDPEYNEKGLAICAFAFGNLFPLNLVPMDQCTKPTPNNPSPKKAARVFWLMKPRQL